MKKLTEKKDIVVMRNHEKNNSEKNGKTEQHVFPKLIQTKRKVDPIDVH